MKQLRQVITYVIIKDYVISKSLPVAFVKYQKGEYWCLINSSSSGGISLPVSHLKVDVTSLMKWCQPFRRGIQYCMVLSLKWNIKLLRIDL